MPDRKTVPYGEWPSPISAADVAEAGVSLGFVDTVGDEIWWGETRPAEDGRATVVRRKADGTVVDALAAPWHARSRVHEYGGKAWLPLPGVGDDDPSLVFAHWDDQRLYVLEPGTVGAARVDAGAVRAERSSLRRPGAVRRRARGPVHPRAARRRQGHPHGSWRCRSTGRRRRTRPGCGRCSATATSSPTRGSRRTGGASRGWPGTTRGCRGKEPSCGCADLRGRRRVQRADGARRARRVGAAARVGRRLDPVRRVGPHRLVEPLPAGRLRRRRRRPTAGRSRAALPARRGVRLPHVAARATSRTRLLDDGRIASSTAPGPTPSASSIPPPES